MIIQPARVTLLISVIWIIVGTFGFFPSGFPFLSSSVHCNIYYVFAGVTGVLLFTYGGTPGALWFNLIFGLVEFYHVVARRLDLFPAVLFQYRRGDDLVHFIAGSVLMLCVLAGLRFLFRRTAH